jgi:cell division protein FtsI (penicillin-binding protein 3)
MGYKRRSGPIDYKGYGRKKRKNAGDRVRIFRLLATLGLVFGIGWILVQLFGSGEESILLAEKSSVKDELFLDRKNIYDSSLQPLAVSFCQYAAYIKPLEVEGKEDTAARIAQVLDLDRKDLLRRLNTERTFIWLGQQLQSEQARQLLGLNLAGVYLQEKPVRYYPHNQSMAQVLGYVKDGKGLAGVELYYDGVLTGGVGHVAASDVSPPVFETGKHVVLTIDFKIQTQLEKAMVQLLKKTEATSVSALAVDTATGAILASVQLPSFDPNRFWEGHPQSQQLRMLTSLIDTGGVSVLFRYAAAVAIGGRSFDSETVSVDSPVVLKPTLMKSGSRSRAGYWWPWAGGGFISDELAELPDPTISANELLHFQQKLGITCADDFDFPDRQTPRAKCQEGQLNGISLLGGFTRLVNSGKPLSLHIMKGTIADDGQFSAYEFTAHGEDLSNVSSVLGQSFSASAGEGASLFAVEYLSPRTQDDAVTVETESHEGKNEVAVLQKECRHDGFLLGAMPAKNPRMTVLVVVEEGLFDLHSASPLRNIMNRFAGRVSADDQEKVDFAAQKLIDPEVLKSQFAGMLSSDEPMAEITRPADTLLMPDVRGKSLRKALVVLQSYMVSVEIKGGGRVVSQSPEPGAEIGHRVVLTLDK